MNIKLTTMSEEIKGDTGGTEYVEEVVQDTGGTSNGWKTQELICSNCNHSIFFYGPPWGNQNLIELQCSKCRTWEFDPDVYLLD